MSILALISLFLCTFILANGQNCGCAPGVCCSKWGYCGTTPDHCGDGCQSGCPTGSPTGSTPPTAVPKPSPPSSSGSVASLISQSAFNSALTSCGINKPNLYNELLSGFTATLPGGLKEFALLMGNIAHESGGFIYTEEIACKGVTQVTAACPYGLYHGRGYIQLSWDYNYKACADALNNQAIFNNPVIVMNDPTVNWQTVQWFWTSRVQGILQSKGYTLGASVRAINGGLECSPNPISSGRVKFIQCFQKSFGVPVDSNLNCPAAAVVDSSSEFNGEVSQQNSSQSQQAMPEFAIALFVLGGIMLILAIAVIVTLALLAKRTEERV